MRSTLLLSLAVASAFACSSAAMSSQEPPAPIVDGGENDGAADASDASAPDARRPIPGPTPGDLKMYDLSILFPIGKSAAESARLLKASSAGARGVLIPEATFVAAGFVPPPPAPGSPSAPDYASLSAVAARVDPCFADLAPTPTTTTCENQLRIVFQEVGNSGTASDSGLHAFYKLTRAELLALVAEMKALRYAQATPAENADHGPLGVHPQMLRQGLAGPMAAGVKDILLGYAGKSNLMRMTRFTSSGPQWDFNGVDVAPNGTASPMTVPSTGGSKTVGFFRGFGDNADGMLMPSSSAEDLSLFARPSAYPTAATAAKQAAYDAALRVQNPTKHSPNTVDCASCHVAQGFQISVGEKALGMSAASNANAFSPPALIAASQMALVADGMNSTLAFNVHMFGYALDVPTVNARVVNETAAALDLIAQLQQ